MKLIFVGAAHEVTGSCHYLEAGGKHILVDCGMEQGVNVFENVALPVDETQIDYVLYHASRLCAYSDDGSGVEEQEGKEK